jgi:hypothetical protein
MKRLEEAHKEQSSEQSEEIHHLRRRCYELEKENHNLRAHCAMFGRPDLISLPPSLPSSRAPLRTVSISSSASSMTDCLSNTSAGTACENLGADIMNPLGLSSAMMPPALQAYGDMLPMNSLQTMTYPLSGHSHPQLTRQISTATSAPGNVDLGAVSMLGTSSFSSLTTPTSIATAVSSQVTTQQPQQVQQQLQQHVQRQQRQDDPNRGPEYVFLSIFSPCTFFAYHSTSSSFSRSFCNNNPRLITIFSRDRREASSGIFNLFRNLLTDNAALNDPQKHLSILSIIAPSLPPQFRPTPLQLSTPHFYGIDLLPNASLRDRLISYSPDIAHNFLAEFDIYASPMNFYTNTQTPSPTSLTNLTKTQTGEDGGGLIIWGVDPLSEVAWEFSKEVLERWSWLVGSVWVERANFWRRQRGEEVVDVRVLEEVADMTASGQSMSAADGLQGGDQHWAWAGGTGGAGQEE